MRNVPSIERLISEIKIFLESSYWLTPLNLEVERNKVLKNSKYNPLFKYPSLPSKKISAFLNELNGLEFVSDNSIENIILERKIKEITSKLMLLLARGTGEITKFSESLYGCNFDKRYLDFAARDSLIKEEFKSYENLDVKDVATEIKKYLASYSIKDWTIKLSDLTDFYIRINSQKKLVLVGKEFNWDFADLDNTLAHEIDGHVLRALNAERQEKEIFKKPLPFYIKTEEGLAAFLGDFCSKTAKISLKHHALKYLAGHLAIKESFSKVYEFLLKSGFTEELAFQRTFRLKRGFEDTSIPGCFVKEAMYYEGMMEVKGYLDNGGSVKKLYSGKFGLDDLKMVSTPKDILIPRRIKEYLDKL